MNTRGVCFLLLLTACGSEPPRAETSATASPATASPEPASPEPASPEPPRTGPESEPVPVDPEPESTPGEPALSDDRPPADPHANPGPTAEPETEDTGTVTEHSAPSANAALLDALGGARTPPDSPRRPVRVQIHLRALEPLPSPGSFDADLVQRALRRRLRAFQRCVERLPSPISEGLAAQVEMHIAPAGTVERVDPVGELAGQNCLVSLARRLRWTPGPTGGAVAFRISVDVTNVEVTSAPDDPATRE